MSYTLTGPAAGTTPRSLVPVAAVTTAVAFGFNAFGIYADGSGADSGALGELLFTCGFSVVAAAVVFGLVVPRARRSAAVGRTALVLAVLAAVSLPLFWAGVTPALGVGAVLLGLAGRNRERGYALSQAALVIGLLAMIGYVATYALDWMSTNGVI